MTTQGIRPWIAISVMVGAFALAAGCASGLSLGDRDGSESWQVRRAYFATTRPEWRFGMKEADLPPAVKEIDVNAANAGYFIATFNNSGRSLQISVELIGPENERFRSAWRQDVRIDWTFVGYQYELPLERMRRSPGVWTVELSLDGQRAGRYRVLVGDRTALARLRGQLATSPPARESMQVRGVIVERTEVTLELKAPIGARIIVFAADGTMARTVELTTDRVSLSLPPGDYRVHATKPGFEEAEETFQLLASVPRMKREISLVPLPAARQSSPRVQLELVGPVGTTITFAPEGVMNETFELTTGRRTFDLTPGAYGIDAAKLGFEPWRQIIELPPGMPRVQREIVLVPIKAEATASPAVATNPGSLISVELRGPPVTEITIFGNRYDLGASGLLSLKLPPGIHEIRATKPGFEPLTESLTLSAGEHRVSRMIVLTPIPSPAVGPPKTVTAPPQRGPTRSDPPSTSSDTEPPRIVLNYPPDQAKVEREQIVVTGLVTHKIGVDRVSLAVNGLEMPIPRDARATSKGYPIRAPVTLLPGENLIEITASDNAGNVTQLVRVVTRTVSAPLASSAPAPSGSERWAVVIGVGRYAHAAIPPLRYTVSDAEAIHRVLVNAAGFKKENVVLLTDTAERKPTLRNIKWALGTFLARQAKKNDTVLIFYAGHGAPEIDPRGIESDGLAKYLIPIDADPDDLYSTALPMDEIHTIFNRTEAERMVVLLDACYSGAAGGRTFSSSKLRMRDLNPDDLFLERLTRAKGRAIITASRPNEVSIELADLKHGLFTYYLVDGLKGAADVNRDGIVTLTELYEYVEAQVSQKARVVGGNQHPVMKGEIEGVLPLVRLRAR